MIFYLPEIPEIYLFQTVKANFTGEKVKDRISQYFVPYTVGMDFSPVI